MRSVANSQWAFNYFLWKELFHRKKLSMQTGCQPVVQFFLRFTVGIPSIMMHAWSKKRGSKEKSRLMGRWGLPSERTVALGRPSLRCSLLLLYHFLLPSLHLHIHSSIHIPPVPFHLELTARSLFYWIQFATCLSGTILAFQRFRCYQNGKISNSGHYHRRRTRRSSPRNPPSVSWDQLSRPRAEYPDPTHWQRHRPQSTGPTTHGTTRAIGWNQTAFKTFWKDHSFERWFVGSWDYYW